MKVLITPRGFANYGVDIVKEMELDDENITLEIKNEDNEKVTFFLKQDLEIITPGLNLILANPYEISVQRKIGYE